MNEPAQPEATARRPIRVVAAWAPSWRVISAGAALDEAAATLARGRISSLTPSAAQNGVRIGMRSRDAQRLCPRLRVVREDLEAAARGFEPVVCALEDAAAGVEVVRPGLCLLVAAGPVGYYGGEDEAAAELREAAASVATEFGPVAIGVGIADGAAAAVLAARTDTIVPPGASARFLSDFDITALAPAALANTLRRLGIATLGAYAELPARAVATRFGGEGIRVHRLARGLDEREPAPRRAPRELSVYVEIDPPARVSEPLVFAARPLAERLHEQLAAVGMVCDRVEIEAAMADGRASARWWRHEGKLSARALSERTRWQLEAWVARNPPTGDADLYVDEERYGFVRLTLRPDGLRIATGTQIDLMGGNQPLTGAAEAAVERLQDLLGHAQVARAVPAGGRGPAEQVTLVPFGDLEPETRGRGPWPGRIPDPAPAMIPDPPVPVRLLDACGTSVVVTARGEVPVAPAYVEIDGVRIAVAGYSHPWPVHERPWEDGGGRRLARLQITTGDGRAYLLAAERGEWVILAGYQ